MSSRMLAVPLAALLAAPILAQAPDAAKPQDHQDKRPKSIKVVGCVAPEAGNPDHFTLSDFTNGTTYRLSGKDVRRYVGKRVEVSGNEQNTLAIVGGLYPSPNVAAQAGAMDPTRAAMAQQGAEGNARPGNVLVPELKVKAVKGVEGDCDQR